MSTTTGTAKWFNDSKGFGFIEQGSGPDVFAHYNSIVGEVRKTLHEGQKVQFTVTQSQKGPQADNIVALERSRCAHHEGGAFRGSALSQRLAILRGLVCSYSA